MVMENDQTNAFEIFDILERHPPQFGMFFDLAEFFVGQFAWLEQNAIRNTDLADVVKQSGHHDSVQVRIGEAQTHTNRAGIRSHAAAVTTGIEIA